MHNRILWIVADRVSYLRSFGYVNRSLPCAWINSSHIDSLKLILFQNSVWLNGLLGMRREGRFEFVWCINILPIEILETKGLGPFLLSHQRVIIEFKVCCVCDHWYTVVLLCRLRLNGWDHIFILCQVRSKVPKAYHSQNCLEDNRVLAVQWQHLIGYRWMDCHQFWYQSEYALWGKEVRTRIVFFLEWWCSKLTAVLVWKSDWGKYDYVQFTLK
jgi:hypothetical protein